MVGSSCQYVLLSFSLFLSLSLFHTQNRFKCFTQSKIRATQSKKKKRSKIHIHKQHPHHPPKPLQSPPPPIQHPHTHTDPYQPAILLTPLPLLLTATLTSPFVNSIYLHLPAYARSSRSLLVRFAANPPPDTLLDIRTVRLNGLWKTTGTAVSELRAVPRRGLLGLANVERVPRAARKGGAEAKKGEKKKGVVQRIVSLFVEPRRRFYINAAEGARRSAEPGVVELVMKAVEANSAKAAEQQQGKK